MISLSVDSALEMTFSSSIVERSVIIGGLGEHPTGGDMFTSAIEKLRPQEPTLVEGFLLILQLLNLHFRL